MGDEKFKRGKLFAAAWRGEFDGVKSIIEPRDINIDSVDENGVTALRFSAQFGHIEISRQVLNLLEWSLNILTFLINFLDIF